MRGLGSLLLVSTLGACGGGSTTPALSPSAPELGAPLPPIDKGAVVDLVPFLFPSYPESKQLGWIAYHRDGSDYYQFSWTAANATAWVHTRIDGDLWLVEDRTWGHNAGRFYRFESALLWAYRYMTVGQQVTDAQLYKVYDQQTCETADSSGRVLWHRLTFVDHRYQDLGGDLGMIEVVELSSAGEAYLYGKTLGLVGWKDSPDRGGVWTYNNTWTNITPTQPKGCKIRGE